MGKGFDKIFDGKKTIPEEVLRRCMVAGGAVALGAKLRDEHNWDGESLMAAPTQGDDDILITFHLICTLIDWQVPLDIYTT